MSVEIMSCKSDTILEKLKVVMSKYQKTETEKKTAEKYTSVFPKTVSRSVSLGTQLETL